MNSITQVKKKQRRSRFQFVVAALGQNARGIIKAQRYATLYPRTSFKPWTLLSSHPKFPCPSHPFGSLR